MPVYRYAVTIRTLLGPRRGVMEWEISGETAAGFLTLLGHREPFSGAIGADGCCRLEGRMVTILRTVAFSASGYVTPRTVELVLREQRNTFQLQGVRLPD